MTEGVVVEFTYVVDGPPQAWARARTGAGRWFMPAKVERAKDLHRREAEPIARSSLWDAEWFVELSCEFFFPIAASWPKWKRELAEREELPHVAKPDLDNLVKLVKDALGMDKSKNLPTVWRDDCLVTRLRASKWYSPTPRTVVTVRRVL